MTLKHFQVRAFHHVPAPNGEICTSGKQDSTPRIHRHTGHGPRVTFHDLELLTCLEVPGPGREVRRAGDQDVFAGVQIKVDVVLVLVLRRDEDERVHAALVAPEHSDTLARVEIPSSGRPIVGACEDKISGADHSDDVEHMVKGGKLITGS